jgi:hypothetical protein
MNHTVEINTYHSHTRDQLHKEFAGEITEGSFNTYQNENKRIWFTKMESLEWKRIKEEKQAKERAALKGEK